MTKDEAVNVIWEYMHLGHELKEADVIFLLGNNDPRTAEHAAMLWNEGWAPYIAISGDGRNHATGFLRDKYHGKTEADVFAAICKEHGVPEAAIITESNANNTGDNFAFTRPLLTQHNIKTDTVILVQKPYMERRSFATGRVQWPTTEFILSTPAGSFTEYIDGYFDPDLIITVMVGDLQRISEYPQKNWQIPQDIPEEVWDAS